jgi:hypothetical protein
MTPPNRLANSTIDASMIIAPPHRPDGAPSEYRLRSSKSNTEASAHASILIGRSDDI